MREPGPGRTPSGYRVPVPYSSGEGSGRGGRGPV
ncbi:hypothetical protein H180DRAFT_03331 [Streptomyces sp. WMMB 322]|nr:hypothetical protein H180DRAFT_03331 [Streptomyces sp. WMMB 322]